MTIVFVVILLLLYVYRWFFAKYLNTHFVVAMTLNDPCEQAVELSYFSITTGKLVEVMYEPKYCNDPNTTMLCSYVMANNRFTEIPNLSIFGENNDGEEKESISDDEFDLFFNKFKTKSEIVNDELSNNVLIYDDDLEKINSVLKDMGLAYSDSLKMNTMKPSKIFYYIPNIKDYNPYRNYLTPKPTNVHSTKGSMCNSNKCRTRESDYKIIPCNFAPGTPRHNNIKDITNYNEKQKTIPSNTRFNYKKIQRDMRFKSHKKNVFSNESQKGVPLKYWLMRYTLFSKYDHGIQLDPESFYSVCPEILSYHIAKRCTNLIALDPFCGAGGNVIQLALTCKSVIAIDIDPYKIKLARHNAKIYGVADKIEFIVGDFFHLAPKLKADVLFMSPPWGGPGYWFDEIYTIESMCEKHFGGGFGIFNEVKSIAPSIAFHMPKNTNIYECLWLANDFGRVEIQQNILNGKLNSITAFYGPFTDVTDDDY